MAKSFLTDETIGDCSSDTCSCKKVVDQTHEYRLGSDDPFWPHYLKEAENYDDMMVDKWEKKMDTLLLFATLFSAIVTAFVIESSQNLQPDNAAITAAAIVEIVGILRNRSLNNEQDSIIQSPDDFQPTGGAFIVNFVWFISLCLSITVALLAGLAKQWSNSLRWDRTAPPCNQARIRQARFNNLIRGRTELVISAIRVIMDAALGLFLIGLLVFLHDLDQNIYLAALVVTVLTGMFYFGTTLAPCFVTFSPYETPVSCRKAWGFFCQLWLALANWVSKYYSSNNTVKVEVNFKKSLSPCEKREKEMASATTPDRLTGDALSWIILHSQRAEPREMAIRAIATLDSKEALEQLGSPGILPKVIQSFTSCFVVRGADDGGTMLEIKESTGIDVVTLHGRALTVLITQISHPDNNKEIGFAESGWVVDPTTKDAVKARFEHLGNLANRQSQNNETSSRVSILKANPQNQISNSDPETKPATHSKAVQVVDGFYDHNEGNLTPALDRFPVDPEPPPSTRLIDSDSKQNSYTKISTRGHNLEARVWALVGLSAWHDFIECDKILRFNQGQAICDLTKSLEWSLSSSLCEKILHTLTKEFSYWAPTISTKNRKETLRHLVKLIPETPLDLQPQFAWTLAVLALNLSHSTSYLVPLRPNSPYSHRTHEEEYDNGVARLLIDHYANKPGRLTRDGRALLLFALTSLMEYYEHCDFDEEAHDNMKQIAQRFQELDDIGKLRSIDIPVTLANNRGAVMKPIDTRDYYVNTLLIYLKLPRTQQHGRHMDEVFIYLLKSINRKRQSRELIQYGPQIIPTVAQVLSQTNDAGLKAECLQTIESYWEPGYSLLYVQILLFYEVPAKAVHLIENQAEKQLTEKSDEKQTSDHMKPQPAKPSTSILLPAASVLFSKMEEQVQNFTDADNRRLGSCMRNIIDSDVLWVLLDILDLNDKIKITPLLQGSSPSTPALQDVRNYLKEMKKAAGGLSGKDLLLDKMVGEYEEELRRSKVEDAVILWKQTGHATSRGA